MGGSSSKPKPEYWSVDNNNFMHNSEVKSINKNHNAKSAVQVTGSDPASGCGKHFTASYTCGTSNTLKSVNLRAEANGKYATFDCEKEAIVCTGGRLYIEDTGNATLKDHAGNTVWQSNTNTTGLALNQYSAAKTKYKRNYIETGEFLRVNEIVGSPSGNCYLQCGSWEGKINLMIGYQVLGCNKPGEQPDPNTYGEYGYVSGSNNDAAGATYSMEQGVQNHNLQGTVGYSDNNMNIRQYQKNLITLDNDYFDLGNYNTPGAPNLQHLENIDLDSCKDACNSRDDCYGFVFTSGNHCWLKPQNNYPMNLKRVPNNSAELYVRKMKVTNDTSCSKDVEQVYGQLYANMPKSAAMTKSTLCQLGEATTEQLKIVSAREKVLRYQLGKLTTEITNLNSQSKTLDKDMQAAIKKLERESMEYQKTLDRTIDEKDKLQNSQAMEETSNLDMISSNMHFMAWTAVAALVVAGSIKASR